MLRESVKVTVLLTVNEGPDAVFTSTGPLVAKAGTTAIITVSAQLVTVAEAPLNVTVLPL